MTEYNLEELNAENAYEGIKIDCQNPDCDIDFILSVHEECPVCRTRHKIKVEVPEE